MTRRGSHWRALVLGAAVALSSGCGPRTMQARMESGEHHADRAASLMDEAQRALDAVEPDRAESLLNEARSQLLDKDVNTNPEAELLWTRLNQLNARVPEVRGQQAQDQRAKKVAERKQVIEASLTKLRESIAQLKPGLADLGPVRSARDGIRQVRADLDWKKELQKEDPQFGQYVDALGVELESAERKADLAEKAVGFAQGPVKTQEAANAQAEKAMQEPKLADRLKLENEAQASYRACAEDAKKRLDEDLGLERTQVQAGGKLVSPAEVKTQCEAGVAAQQKLVLTTQKQLDREAKLQAAADAKAKKAAQRAEAKKKAQEAKAAKLAKRKKSATASAGTK